MCLGSTNCFWNTRLEESVICKNICVETTLQTACYAKKLEHLVEYFKEVNATEMLTEDGKAVKYPIIDVGKVIDFLGYLSGPAYTRSKLAKPADITPEMPEPYSVFTLDGYKSAILSPYKAMRPALPPSSELSSSLLTFINSK